jgi:hypothetical protein
MALRRVIRTLRLHPGVERVNTELHELIPGEITDDEFSRLIEGVAATEGVREILEIGSSTGEGSTAAWIRGALRNPIRPRLHCMEVSVERYRALANRWGGYPFVRCYNLSTVPLEQFASADEVGEFYRNEPSRLRDFRLETVLGWRDQDLEYVRKHELSSAGIAEIKRLNGIDTFDAVLIDGSEFTGRAELEEVHGARFLLLDDTETFKNWANSRVLAVDVAYRLIRADPSVRNGFAVFEKVY